MTEKNPIQQAESPTNEILDEQKQSIKQPVFNKEVIEEQLKKVEELYNDKLISIEGVINWKLVINTDTKNTEVVYNATVSNEGAILALSQQIINAIIGHEEKGGAKSKDTQRLRIAQFELQKLFGRCLTYILDNKDKELAIKEDAK